MVFDWWRRRRRRKLVAEPFPPEWDDALRANFAQYQSLSEVDRKKLQDDLRVFAAEKYWEGCNGLEMTDEIRVTIAAQACMLVLGFDGEYFDSLQTVLVYPGGYLADKKEIGPAGLVTESTDLRLGEAWNRGPVILSWSDVLKGGRIPNDGHNVVYHEFAHVLDMHDLMADGVPAMVSQEQYETWHDVMSSEYNLLVKHSARQRATLLDHYGATNEAEFFAVATECFFEKPAEMTAQHPRLYKILREFYHQDPVKRVRR